LIPDFDQNGYLPPGVHQATIDEIAERFGRQSELRQVQMESLQWLLEAARKLPIRRIVIDGSFTTDRHEPNDVDCALLLDVVYPPELEDELEPLKNLPYLQVMALNNPAFDLFVDKVFSRDRRNIGKGIIEVVSWN
jgi:hypothetical protein